MDGREHAERVGLALSLHDQEILADQVLEISRSVPVQYSKVLLSLRLIADIPTWYHSQGRARVEAENHERIVFVDDLAVRTAVIPLYRPVGNEEAKLIKLEKLDLFREFQQQMKALGASDEAIMQFFLDLNLQGDELEALGKKYERWPREVVVAEAVANLGPKSPIRITGCVNDELRDIAGFQLATHFAQFVDKPSSWLGLPTFVGIDVSRDVHGEFPIVDAQ
jgi:hypothetical protein